jgi:ribonuclease III
MNTFWEIIQHLDIVPRNKELYQKAFTHRSYLNESHDADESNERLEFLGDSVLSYIISSYLYENRPNDAEGDLTNLRSYIVKTDSLAKAASKIHLGEELRLSKGEELSRGRENNQLLANTFEAVLGAIYLDLGMEDATRYIHGVLLPLYAHELESGPPRDAKSQLQELAQTKTKTAPKYKILETTGPDHAKTFRVGVFVQGELIGEGEGTNKQQAEEEAAKQGLSRLTQS